MQVNFSFFCVVLLTALHNEIDGWPPNLLPLDQQGNEKCVIQFETASPGSLQHAVHVQINPQENCGAVVDHAGFAQPKRCQSVEVISYPVHIHREPSSNTSPADYQHDFLKEATDDSTFLRCPIYLDPFDKCLVHLVSNKEYDECEIPTVANDTSCIAASNQYIKQ